MKSKTAKELLKSRIMNYSDYINPASGKNKVFTREEIGKMTTDEFAKNEEAIMLQMKFIDIPTNAEVQARKEQNYEEDPTAEWLWVTQFTKNTCDTCADLDGTTYLTKEDAPQPPLHDHCACSLVKTVKA